MARPLAILTAIILAAAGLAGCTRFDAGRDFAGSAERAVAPPAPQRASAPGVL